MIRHQQRSFFILHCAQVCLSAIRKCFAIIILMTFCCCESHLADANIEFLWVAQPPVAQASRTTNAATPAATTARLHRPHRPHRPHPPPELIAAIKNTIYYLRKYNVLVCKQHATAIQNLDAHLRDQHATAHKLWKEIVKGY
jgi:hypothetical protein